MNSGHMNKQVRVHVCMSRSLRCDFVLLELLNLVDSRNITVQILLKWLSIRLSCKKVHAIQYFME